MGTDLAITESKQASLFDSSAEQIGTALKAAELWAQSQVVPARYHKRPADILVAVEMGRRYGLAPFDALRSIYAIEGTPSLSAAMVYGLCRAHPAWAGLDEQELADKNGKVVGYQFTANRKGANPITRWYTMQDALEAGLTERKNWKRMRRRMLLVRARHYALCDQYPDVVLGMGVVDVSEDGTIDNMNDATVVVDEPKRDEQKPQTVKEMARAKAEEVGAVAPAPVVEDAAKAQQLSDAKVEEILGEFWKYGVGEDEVVAAIGRDADNWDDNDLQNLRQMLLEARKRHRNGSTKTESE